MRTSLLLAFALFTLGLSSTAYGQSRISFNIPDCPPVDTTGGGGGNNGDDTTSVAEHLVDAAVYLYPNPVSTNLNISVSGSDNIEYIELYTLSGAVLKVFRAGNNREAQINLSEFPSGIYLLDIHTNRAAHKKRIVKY